MQVSENDRMGKRKHFGAGAVVALLLGAVLAACGGNNPNQTGGGAVPAKDDGPMPASVLIPQEVRAIMAKAASAIGDDLVVAVTDRRGVVLGVGTRFAGVFDYAAECASATCPRTDELAADCGTVDLAVQLARTAAFFSADQTPLTSRSVRFLSGEHFPSGIRNTGAAALFGIENTNRGCSFDAVVRPFEDRIPRALNLEAVVRRRSGGEALRCESSNDPDATCGCSTGIATLPGGVPIFKNGRMAGGIGVAIRGVVLQPDPVAAGDAPDQILRRTDRNAAFELAEFAARAFAGDDAGLPTVGARGLTNVCDASNPTRPTCCSNPTPCTFGILPSNRLPFDPVIFVDGIEIPEVATHPRVPDGVGTFGDVSDLIIDPASPTTPAAQPVATDWLFGPVAAQDAPAGAAPLSAAEVESIISAARTQALAIRGAIRLPLRSRTAMVLAISDTAGNLLGAFRMDDATVFSIDVAIAKSRNVVYFSNPDIAPIDTYDCPGPTAAECRLDRIAIPPGTAVTNRTLSFAAQPFFPSGIDGTQPGPYRLTFINDSAAPCTNGGEPANGRQNGIVFFPGSAPLYRDGVLIGGLGISGDGVEQDDIVTIAGAVAAPGYEPPSRIRADQIKVRGVRLPYVKFNRRPEQ